MFPTWFGTCAGVSLSDFEELHELAELKSTVPVEICRSGQEFDLVAVQLALHTCQEHFELVHRNFVVAVEVRRREHGFAVLDSSFERGWQVSEEGLPLFAVQRRGPVRGGHDTLSSGRGFFFRHPHGVGCGLGGGYRLLERHCGSHHPAGEVGEVCAGPTRHVRVFTFLFFRCVGGRLRWLPST